MNHLIIKTITSDMMVRIPSHLLFIVTTCVILLSLNNSVSAQDKNVVVRIAKLQIDSSQLKIYKAALQEEIETSVRVEPGVLSLNAVSDTNNPTHIIIMEIYASQDAYKAHIETPHFKKYKSTTANMVKSLELMVTDPVALASKQEINRR